jgi:hypothetical protein
VCLNLQQTETYPYISPVTVADTNSAMVRMLNLRIPRCAQVRELIRRRSSLYNLEETIMVGLTKQPDEENMDWILIIKTRLDIIGEGC